MSDLSGFININNLPIDTFIAIISFLIGKVFTKKERGVGIFLQVSLLLLRLAKHYFDTHPEADKLASKYKLEVDQMYHKHTAGTKSGALG
jgi:hypothetical protein